MQAISDNDITRLKANLNDILELLESVVIPNDVKVKIQQKCLASIGRLNSL